MEGEYVHTGNVTVDGNQKSCGHQLSLVVYPFIYKVLYIPGGSPDFWTINSMLMFLQGVSFVGSLNDAILKPQARKNTLLPRVFHGIIVSYDR